MDRITTFLWFDGRAMEAASFYTDPFPDSHVSEVTLSTMDYPGGKDGDVITVAFSP